MSERLNQAIAFASEAHKNQVRKVDGTPYILHPMEAATIVGTMTNDEDIIIAALLHDVVEDAGVSFQQIETMFGMRVSELVASETEEKYAGINPSETWKRRKEESLDKLRQGDRSVKILWLGDKLSNARAMYRSYLRLGEDLFNHFHQKDKKMHEWYYRTVAEATDEFYDFPTHEELRVLIHKIFE